MADPSEKPDTSTKPDVYDVELLSGAQYRADITARWRIVAYELKELGKDCKTYWKNIKTVTKDTIERIKKVAP